MLGVANSLELTRVVDIVCEEFSVGRDALLGRDRAKSLRYARVAAWYVATQLLGLSYLETGRAFGRNHSSVIIGVRNAERCLTLRAPRKDYEAFTRVLERYEEEFPAELSARKALRGGARPGAADARTISVSFPPAVLERLEALLRSQCFGNSIAEVVERLVGASIYGLVEGDPALDLEDSEKDS